MSSGVTKSRLEKRARLLAPINNIRPARAGTHGEGVVAASGFDQPPHVADDFLPHVCLANDFPGRVDVIAVHDRRDAERLRPRDRARCMVLAEHALLSLGTWIPNLQLEHESVQLGQRKRVRPLLLDRILRGEGDERARQGMRDSVVRHRQLLHCLEHGRLCARRRAVDFIGQQEICEHRTAHKLERSGVLAVDRRPRDVPRQQVGGHLDAAIFETQRGGDGSHQEGFGHAGRTFQQHVAAAEQGSQAEFDRFVLAEHDRLDGGAS